MATWFSWWSHVVVQLKLGMAKNLAIFSTWSGEKYLYVVSKYVGLSHEDFYCISPAAPSLTATCFQQVTKPLIWAPCGIWFCNLSSFPGKSFLKLLMPGSLICFWGASQSWQVFHLLGTWTAQKSPVMKRECTDYRSRRKQKGGWWVPSLMPAILAGKWFGWMHATPG